MFTEPGERAKAMGIYGFVCSAGGSIGVLLGGIVTTSLSWHWIFLINLPLGMFVYVLCLWLVPAPAKNAAHVRIPLVPLAVFRCRAFLIANVAGVLWAAAMFVWFFFGALYVQRILGGSAMRVALAFLPANLVTAVLSLGFSARIVGRFGIKIPVAVGLLLAALGLALFSGAPVKGNLLIDVLPAMVLLGIGSGVALNPLLLAAMSSVKTDDTGLASGLMNTSFMMGGALGLAVLASVAAAWTHKLSTSAAESLAALNGGYHLAFAMSAVLATTAAVLGALLLPRENVNEMSTPQGVGITT
jgi:predicted MFS family arabinose efflux permease